MFSSIKRTKLPSIGLGLEYKRNGLCFRSANGHVLGLFTVRFLPRSDGVFPRRKITKTKLARFARHGVVGVLEDSEIAMHPRVNVALHGDEFCLVVFLDDRRCSRWLRLVPLAVQ